MKAFDTSRYSTGNKPIDRSVFDDLRSNYGCGLAIIGAWHGIEGYDAAETSLATARAARLLTATYIALSPSHSGREAVDAGRALIGNEWGPLRFVAIDVEVPGVTMAHIVDAIKAVVEYGQTPILYSAAWFWNANLADVTVTAITTAAGVARLYAWDADYDGKTDLDYKNVWGGLLVADVIGDQFTNTTNVGTIDVDFSVFSDAWLASLPTNMSLADAIAALQSSWISDMADLSNNALDLTKTPLDVMRLAYHTLYTENRNAAWKRLLGGK